jgi:hypothetical protein
VDTKKIVDNIANSINEHPEKWIDSGHRFIYFEDSSIMKKAKERVFPETYADVSLIYSFYNSFFYADLEKPFEYKFKDKKLKQLVQAIKLYKLKKLKKDVGHLLWVEEKNKELKSKAKEEQTTNEDGPKKL